MNTDRTKLFTITMFAIPLLSFVIFRDAPVMAAAGDDPAATYKAKCAACHSPTAAKFFDAAKTDEELVQITMQGRKGEKPPFMPGFEAKGMTTDEAQALVAYMWSIKPK
jgi:mono/diheme cytochrome c family protein